MNEVPHITPEHWESISQGYDFTFYRVVEIAYQDGQKKDVSYPRMVVETTGPVDLKVLADFYDEHGDEWPCKCEMGKECMPPKELVFPDRLLYVPIEGANDK